MDHPVQRALYRGTGDRTHPRGHRARAHLGEGAVFGACRGSAERVRRCAGRCVDHLVHGRPGDVGSPSGHRAGRCGDRPVIHVRNQCPRLRARRRARALRGHRAGDPWDRSRVGRGAPRAFRESGARGPLRGNRLRPRGPHRGARASPGGRPGGGQRPRTVRDLQGAAARLVRPFRRSELSRDEELRLRRGGRLDRQSARRTWNGLTSFTTRARTDGRSCSGRWTSTHGAISAPRSGCRISWPPISSANSRFASGSSKSAAACSSVTWHCWAQQRASSATGSRWFRPTAPRPFTCSTSCCPTAPDATARSPR